MDIHQASVCSVAVTPYRFKQLFAGEYLPRGTRKSHEQIEFKWRQRQFLATTMHAMTLNIDDKIPKTNQLFTTVISPSQSRSNTRD